VSAEGLWERLFADWAPCRQHDADTVAAAAMARVVDRFRLAHDERIAREESDLAAWLRTRANELCGAADPLMADLFGCAPSSPAWRDDLPPLERLAAYAADADVPPARRREANSTVTLSQRRGEERARRAALSAPSLHPIGLLMLVPDDAGV
jgi:hypothetical protein